MGVRRAGVPVALSLIALLAVAWWVFVPSRHPGRLPTGAAAGAPAESSARGEISGADENRPEKPARAPVMLPPRSEANATDDACDPATICGVVLDPGGRRLPGALCGLYRSDAPQGLRFYRSLGDWPAVPVASVRSDATGAFQLTAPPGYWALEVEYEGLARWREESLARGSYRLVQLERSRALLVHVENEDGIPVADARLLLLDNAYSSRDGARAEARSDATGSAVLELPYTANNWAVETSHASYRSEVFELVVPETAVQLERSVTLIAGIRIRGRVTDPRLGRAPPGAQVVLDATGPDPTRTIHCDTSGRFDSGPAFDREMSVEVTARAPGYGEVRRVIELETERVTDGVLELDLALEDPEVRARGRVVTTDGDAPGPVDLFVQPFELGNYYTARKLVPLVVRWRAVATTDASGRFDVGGLMSGRPYQLLAVPRAGYSNARVKIPAMEPGAVHDAGELTVAPGGGLFGRALHADGTPARHLRVSAIETLRVSLSQSRDPDFFPTYFGGRRDAYTNQSGRFEIAMMPAGSRYSVYWGETWLLGGERHAGDFEIRGGEATGPVEILVPSEEVEEKVPFGGSVLDPAGEPIASVLVELWSGPENPLMIGDGLVGAQLTDASGRFELELQPSKAYRVTATDLRGRFETEIVDGVQVGGDRALSIELWPRPTPSRSLEGTISDANGAPLAGIDVTLHLSPLVQKCSCFEWGDTTDEYGRFSFGLVADGQHELAAVDPAGRFPSRVVEVRPGDALDIVLE